MVVLGMIVAEVLVYVQRRSRTRRDDQCRGNHEREEPAHPESVLRLSREEDFRVKPCISNCIGSNPRKRMVPGHS